MRQAVGGIWSKDGDATKLQTAFRNGVISSIETVKTKFKPGWMPRRREQAFFAGWDAIYREIRERNLASGAAVAAPADTTVLHERNVTKQIKETHGTRRRIPVAVAEVG